VAGWQYPKCGAVRLVFFFMQFRAILLLVTPYTFTSSQ